jgi:hypothetical protein
VLLHVRPTIHELAITGRALEIQPFMTARFQPMMMHAPFTDEKIEIAQASGRRGGSLFGLRRNNRGHRSGNQCGREKDSEVFHGVDPAPCLAKI